MHNVWNSNLSNNRNFSMSSGHGTQPTDSAVNEHNRCLLGAKKGGQGKAATTIILQTLWSTWAANHSALLWSDLYIIILSYMQISYWTFKTIRNIQGMVSNLLKTFLKIMTENFKTAAKAKRLTGWLVVLAIFFLNFIC